MHVHVHVQFNGVNHFLTSHGILAATTDVSLFDSKPSVPLTSEVKHEGEEDRAIGCHNAAVENQVNVVQYIVLSSHRLSQQRS